MSRTKAEARAGLSCPVVVIGASAGGLEAFTALLKALPANTGLAFVLIQHLEPKHESALAKLLAKNTEMPLLEVSDGVAVESNHIYVIPPNKAMTIRRGILRLTPRVITSGMHRPIDEFAIALAGEQKSAAIGVVLSGSGSDGTQGLRAIKAEGGITFAQDPKTAQWPAMPVSAISAGAVDFVLPPKRIAAELARIGRHPYVAAASEVPDGGDLERIYLLIRAATGVDFRLYKQPTVRRRVARRMALQKIASLHKYAQFVKQNPAEADALSDDMFIHVTGFFRDPECFQALHKQALPRLRLKRPAGEPIRIWAPGCSTGEEVYSIAMLLLEDLGEQANRLKIQIFGTDMSEHAIDQARTGVYSEVAVAHVSAARLKRFFAKVEHGYQIDKSVRDICVFARHDLGKDPPFSNLDLIVCRNVLIYMGSALQKRILSVFQYALKPDGYLFLGKAESVSALPEAFATEDGKHRIYSRKPGAALYHFALSAGYREQGGTLSKAPPGGLALDFRKDAERTLMERYAPPALIVDQDLQIIHFQGDTSPYVAPATGQPSFNLLKMVRPEFVVDLQTAIHKAKREGVTVRRDVSIEHRGKSSTVRLEVAPVKRRNSKKCDFLVVFKEIEPVVSATGAFGTQRKRESERRAGLQRDLESTREYLRKLIAEHETAQEEMKAANEEVLSSNEELQSTNEELETAKEELQSSNEELATLNQELQNRNAELNLTTNDLNNLLVGVEIPVLVLDASLRIRRFTPGAGKLFNLIETDVGRPFRHIASNLDVDDWDELFSVVIERQRRIVREVRNRSGRWYSLRLRPYRTGDRKAEGVIVVLFDIDSNRRALEEARKSRDYAQSIVETIREPLAVLDARFQVVTVNRSFCDTFRISRKEIEGQPFFAVGDAEWNVSSLRELIEGILPKQARIEDFELDHEFPRIGRRQLLINARQIRQDSGLSDLILIAFEDVTARKRTDEALRQSESTIHALLESAAQTILAVNEDGKIVRANRMTEKMFGYSMEELLGQPVERLLPETLRKSYAERHKEFFADPQKMPLGIGFEVKGRRKNGTQFPIEVSLGFIDTPAGRFAAGFAADITQRKRLEKAAETTRQEIRALAANLLTAQEEERRRVSRELHDDLCQQLASLAFDVGGFAEDLPASLVSRHARIRALQVRVVKVSEDARHIAYRLHPSVLDDLGLGASVEALCKDFSQRHGIPIEFVNGGMPNSLPLEVASCVYRVCQEGLNNIAKHSKAKRASVKLTAQADSVALFIKDEGVGFHPEAVKGKGGLGLIGMKERARIANGQISIESEPGDGARIELKIPLSS